MPSNSEEYYKKWYAENKEAHKAYLSEELECELCNKKIKRSNMRNHKKSAKHLLNEEKLKLENINKIINTETNINKIDEIKNIIK